MATDAPFFDLQKALTTDPAFKNDVNRLSLKVATMEDEGKMLGDADMNNAMKALLQKCDYNPSLILPYFFPNFSDEKPMTLWKYPHAFSMMSFVPNGSITIQASRQVGKCVAGGTVVTCRTEAGSEVDMSIKALFYLAKDRLI